jgi:hypothetical protein
MPNHLTDSDKTWLEEIGKKAQTREDGGPRASNSQRQFLLQQLRRKLDADYINFGAGRYHFDGKKSVGTIVEFYDDADDKNTFLSAQNAREKCRTNFFRYARVAHEMNTHPLGLRFLADISLHAKPLITVESSELQRIVTTATKLSALARPNLLWRKWRSGLRDFMFSLYRHGENWGTGIGLHRSYKKPRFSERDRQIAYMFSTIYAQTVHVVNVDFPIHPGELTAKRRMLFPLIMDDIPIMDIALLTNSTIDAVNSQLKNICDIFGAARNRKSLIALLRRGAMSQVPTRSLEEVTHLLFMLSSALGPNNFFWVDQSAFSIVSFEAAANFRNLSACLSMCRST